MNKIKIRIFYIFLLFLVFNCPALLATGNFNDASTQKNKDTSKINVSTLLDGLKNGALLVRLKTSENTVKILNARGRTKEAESLKASVFSKNMEVYCAFKEKYKFGQVYFFYSNNSDKVKSGQTEGIFLDSTLTENTSIKINTDKFYVAEIGDINSEATTSSIHGFHIMDMNLKEIEVKNHASLKSIWHFDLLKMQDRTPADMVELFNKRLKKALEKQ